MIRDAADLAIAFATLEGYSLDDLLPAGRAVNADRSPGARADAPADPHGPGPRERTVADDGPADTDQVAAGPGPVFTDAAATDATHEHRRALQVATRARRPGTVPVREQPCTTPLRSESAPTGGGNPNLTVLTSSTAIDGSSSSSVSRRRSACQDAPH